MKGGMTLDGLKINLAACRMNARKTQKEWGAMIGVSPMTIMNWELGRTQPSAGQLAKISRLSGIPIGFIFVPSKS
jgi:transcriptional regulator with XRE-family HTH domain